MFSSLRQPRTYVKFAARQVYYMALTEGSTAVIDTIFDPQTESAEDNVEAAGFVVGSLAYWRTRGYVNAVIDKAADWRLARKAQKEAAKSPTAVVVSNESLYKLAQQ